MKDQTDYDDEAALTEYVWSFLTDLMNPFEQKMCWAELARGKANIGCVATSTFILKRHGIEGDPEAEAILASGLDEYRTGVTRRILTEFADQITVNRCPFCGKVLRTPKAMQCQWCFEAWHPKEPRSVVLDDEGK